MQAWQRRTRRNTFIKPSPKTRMLSFAFSESSTIADDELSLNVRGLPSASSSSDTDHESDFELASSSARVPNQFASSSAGDGFDDLAFAKTRTRCSSMRSARGRASAPSTEQRLLDKMPQAPKLTCAADPFCASDISPLELPPSAMMPLSLGGGDAWTLDEEAPQSWSGDVHQPQVARDAAVGHHAPCWALTDETGLAGSSLLGSLLHMTELGGTAQVLDGAYHLPSSASPALCGDLQL